MKPKPYNHRKTAAFTNRVLTSKQVVFPIGDLKTRKGLVARQCPTCHKDFAIYACKTKNTKKNWCSRKCWEEGRTEVARLSRAMGRTDKSIAKKILAKAGFYKDHKDEYRDKIISHKESPTGRAYVGINKSPFMPAADNGHGFQGVLLQDENRVMVQCHACGKWMQKIANKHLASCSGLTVAAYKEKYGIGSDTGLVSDETSLRLTKAALKNKESIREKFSRSNVGRGKHGRSKPHSMEFFNKHGTCPLQLKTRLYEFIRCNRELPGQGNRGRPIYKALRRRYGSFSHALTAHGLPYMKRQGTTMRFAFADGTTYKYNINQFHDREELYQLMMQKCPVLHTVSA